MISDPYQILGIPKNASDEEVKRAYRELSRKYHPDSYADNPLASLAEEKFKEVQEAYDLIMNQRQNGGYSGSYADSSYADSSMDEDDRLREVAAHLQRNNYRDAAYLLDQIPNRTARWFYFSALTQLGLGNNAIALSHAQTAVQMEPSNPDYSNFYRQLQFQTGRYQSTQRQYRGGGMDAGDMCCNLCIADTCCECMGGDLCTCF